ncbi:MAG: hypothetical protein QM673_07400 [Gordonia sp. (in: high G+C Gram-positive bacteria)]
MSDQSASGNPQDFIYEITVQRQRPRRGSAKRPGPPVRISAGLDAHDTTGLLSSRTIHAPILL